MPTSKTRISRIALFPARQDFYNPRGRDERIDWRKIKTYSYLENIISAEIWAWEFLRRNQRYQRAVDVSVDPKNSNNADKNDVAYEWGLNRLKHYRERFDEGDSPIWSAVQPKEIILALTPENELSAARPIRTVTVQDGEACIVFRFRDALGNKDLLLEQIDNAKVQLLADFEKLNKIGNLKDKFDNAAAKKLLTYLRIADAMNDPMMPPTEVIASVLLSKAAIGRDRAILALQPLKLQGAINQPAHASSNMVYARGYLRILLRKNLSNAVSRKSPVKHIEAKAESAPPFVDQPSAWVEEVPPPRGPLGIGDELRWRVSSSNRVADAAW